MIPCQFYVLNQCRNGDNCRFSHDPAVARPGGANRPCHDFAAKGICRYGNLCVFVHRVEGAEGEESAYYFGDNPDANEVVGLYGQAPVDPNSRQGQHEAPKGTTWAKVARLPHQQAEDEQKELAEQQAAKKEQQQANARPQTGPLLSVPLEPKPAPKPSKLPCKFFFSEKGCRAGDSCRFSHVAELSDGTIEKCGICLDDLRFKRIGVLTHCDHLFCLSCIKEWRSSELSESDQTKGTTQSCPVCRVKSAFVVPSDIIPRSTEEKKRMIEVYKQKCANIPCKYGDDSCPFGTSCLYFHKAFDPAKLNLRFVKSADGSDRAIASTMGKLSDLILQ